MRSALASMVDKENRFVRASQRQLPLYDRRPGVGIVLLDCGAERGKIVCDDEIRIADYVGIALLSLLPRFGSPSRKVSAATIFKKSGLGSSSLTARMLLKRS